MSESAESFTTEAFNVVWNGLHPERQQDVRDKARWERISLAAALKWMEPDHWREVLAESVREMA